jgi:hypothetical protein
MLYLLEITNMSTLQSTSSISLPATLVSAKERAVEATRGGGRVIHNHTSTTHPDHDFITCKVFGCETDDAI